MYLINTVAFIGDEAIDTLFVTYLPLHLALEELKRNTENMEKEYKCVNYTLKLTGVTELTIPSSVTNLSNYFTDLGAELIYIGMADNVLKT
jgi:hypothetical protein